MIDEAIQIGKKLAFFKLIDGASGNLSFRVDGEIVITKTGVMLDELNDDSFVKVKIGEKKDIASSDLIVHQKIYEKTDYKAVLHCHGVYNVVLSLKMDEIVPVDLEGKMYLGKIKVVDGVFGSETLAEKIAEEIAEKGIVIVRAHGMYVADKDLTTAFKKAMYAEHSCEVLFNYLSINRSEYK
ncbi:MAG TPA: fructose-bisphosphate aldolase [Archaeoglobus veneficus]|nr:fructose-bisphosphate aldolase [Archaeoglobus veneficus]